MSGDGARLDADARTTLNKKTFSTLGCEWFFDRRLIWKRVYTQHIIHHLANYMHLFKFFFRYLQASLIMSWLAFISKLNPSPRHCIAMHCVIFCYFFFASIVSHFFAIYTCTLRLNGLLFLLNIYNFGFFVSKPRSCVLYYINFATTECTPIISLCYHLQ